MVNETARLGWSTPRAAEGDNDTLVSAAIGTMKQANVPAYSYKPSSRQNGLEVAFTMHADGEACAATLFAARENGDIVMVWTGTLTAGKQQATDGGVWVDTMGSTTDNWITTIKEVDGGGNDRMSRIVLDTCGYKDFFVQFTGLAGDETAKAHYSGF